MNVPPSSDPDSQIPRSADRKIRRSREATFSGGFVYSHWRAGQTNSLRSKRGSRGARTAISEAKGPQIWGDSGRICDLLWRLQIPARIHSWLRSPLIVNDGEEGTCDSLASNIAFTEELTVIDYSGKSEEARGPGESVHRKRIEGSATSQDDPVLRISQGSLVRGLSPVNVCLGAHDESEPPRKRIAQIPVAHQPLRVDGESNHRPLVPTQGFLVQRAGAAVRLHPVYNANAGTAYPSITTLERDRSFAVASFALFPAHNRSTEIFSAGWKGNRWSRHKPESCCSDVERHCSSADGIDKEPWVAATGKSRTGGKGGRGKCRPLATERDSTFIVGCALGEI